MTMGGTSGYLNAQHEKKDIKDKTKLQTAVDVRSDPAYNSDEGYETRFMNPSDEKDIVKYKTDLPYDGDIIDTKAHLKESESTQGHKLDPIPFLAQTKEQDVPVAQQQDYQSLNEYPQTSRPSQFSQGKHHAKTAVKGKSGHKAEAKTKLKTHAEKMQDFVSMRKRMMSNWGTK